MKIQLTHKTASIKNNITIVKDARFTTCKKTNETDGCAYWNLNAGELIHDKEQKKITYKNASLDLNNVPVLYLPYFAHPDPTVKRESGFLPPTLANLGGDIGSTIKIPYFYPVSQSADFTVSPVYYFKQHPLLLGEYREKFKNGDISLEGGFTQGYKEVTITKTDGSRHHLYGNLNLIFSDKILDQTILNAKVQQVNNPTYLRVNKINSTNDGFKKNLIKETESFINKTHGTLKEESAIEIYEKKFNVKLNTNQEFYKCSLDNLDTSQFEWYIGGKVDGLYIDNNDRSKSYIVEVKNRTKGFFSTLRDYEKYAGISFSKRSVQDYTKQNNYPPNPVLSDEDFDLSFLNDRSGMEFSSDHAFQILEKLGFGVELIGDKFRLSVPSWRNDISIKEDIVEEVLRIDGFDNWADLQDALRGKEEELAKPAHQLGVVLVEHQEIIEFLLMERKSGQL